MMERYSTPELAAQAWEPGKVLETSYAPDGRLAVVVLEGAEVPVHIICDGSADGWVAIDGDDPPPLRVPRHVSSGDEIRVDLPSPKDTAPPVSFEPVFRSTWTSTRSEAQLAHMENLGVEFTRGTAPTGTVAIHVKAGGEEFQVPVHDGVFWLVRWDVPDSGDDDDEPGIPLHFMKPL